MRELAKEWNTQDVWGNLHLQSVEIPEFPPQELHQELFFSPTNCEPHSCFVAGWLCWRAGPQKTPQLTATSTSWLDMKTVTEQHSPTKQQRELATLGPRSSRKQGLAPPCPDTRIVLVFRVGINPFLQLGTAGSVSCHCVVGYIEFA